MRLPRSCFSHFHRWRIDLSKKRRKVIVWVISLFILTNKYEWLIVGNDTKCRTTQCTLMHNHYKNVMLDNKAFQSGNPQNLHGKDSPIHRLLLHRDFHSLFSPPKVLGIRKIHVDIHVRVVKIIFPLQSNWDQNELAAGASVFCISRVFSNVRNVLSKSFAMMQ